MTLSQGSRLGQRIENKLAEQPVPLGPSVVSDFPLFPCEINVILMNIHGTKHEGRYIPLPQTGLQAAKRHPEKG